MIQFNTSDTGYDPTKFYYNNSNSDGKANTSSDSVSSFADKLVDIAKKTPNSQINSIDDIIESGQGVTEYNGVGICLNTLLRQLSVGDISNEEDTISVGLSNGYSFKFNRNSTKEVGKIMKLFSPKDQNAILRAIQQDAMCRKKKVQMEKTEMETYDSLVKKSVDTLDKEDKKSQNNPI